MAATPIGWAAGDGGTSLAAATWSTTLLALANGSASTSTAIDNTEATVTTAAYDTGALFINLGASTALGTSGIISLQAVVLNSYDGTNYDAAFAANSQLFPLAGQRVASFPTSVSAQFLLVRDIPLLPTLFKVAILNNLGVAFPASGVTATFYRYRGQSG